MQCRALAASPNEPAGLLMFHDGITEELGCPDSRTETVPSNYSPGQDPQWPLTATE